MTLKAYSPGKKFQRPSLKAIQFQNQHEILTLTYFPPKFEFLNYFFSWSLPSKCFYIIPVGDRTSLNVKVIISIVSFKQNMSLKIQILVGNTLMSRIHVGFEIELPLVLLLTRIFSDFSFS